jgi:NADPH-dependent 2,4-dienoyl-CoA reductase/sulfur reductase-like enzyme/nitrite reductase/ring-hydroxylating ferredoxin subunit
MGGATELSGPDLSQGIAFDELEEGKPFVGHAGGKPVVLVRRGETVHALGGSCTHYGAPLGDGLVVGETLRCPWHHACFSLESGQAIGAPALAPLPCYAVAHSGGRITVGAEMARPAPPVLSRAPASVLVLGAGAAGAACVEMLRQEGYTGPITLLGAEAPGPVDRPNLSKDYLAGTAPEEWIPLGTAERYRELGVELLPTDAAVALDPAARTVRTESGRELGYEALLYATGAEPIRLPIPGGDAANVFLLRSLADSRAIIERAQPGRQAVVIGASFIGLEVAASLRHRGVEVQVVAPEEVPLARVLGDEVGRFVKALHEEKGITFHLGTRPSEIGQGLVKLEGGGRLPADFVVMGVGVSPRTQLAEAAGLTVDNGVVVDAELRTSAEGVWAAGDVARFPERRAGELARIEHWVLAERQGQAVARSMLGKGGPFRDPPFFWSAHYDVVLAYVGHAAGWDRVEVRGSLDKRDACVSYWRGDRPLAVMTLFRDQVSLAAEAAFEKGDLDAVRALLAAQ